MGIVCICESRADIEAEERGEETLKRHEKY